MIDEESQSIWMICNDYMDYMLKIALSIRFHYCDHQINASL